MYVDDTIAAIATAAGHGGIGVVRVSGPRCTAIADAVFAASRPAKTWVARHLYRGRVVGACERVLDEGLAVLMRTPHSYTGEDVLELHCHGSPAVLHQVLTRVLSCGARAALPGEFTRRAFLNGRLDLAQAEAVIDLVRARTGSAVQLAAQQLAGQLSDRLNDLRTRLIRLKALLEAQIDFSEEDFTVLPVELNNIIDKCITDIISMIRTYDHGKVVRDGIRIAIIGKPNVGKSSLLNALLGEERAIVTPIAGTTRDTIEEVADFEGIPVVLTDTAGLRQIERADPIERIGMQRTDGTIAGSQLLLAVVDAAAPIDADDLAVLEVARQRPAVLVLNKIDVSPPAFDVAALADSLATVAVSATQRRGLDDLRQTVVSAVTHGQPIDETHPAVTNARHHAALLQAEESLNLARRSIAADQPADLVAVDVQDAIDHVGSITGIVSNEDVLDRIFSEFCIGK